MQLPMTLVSDLARSLLIVAISGTNAAQQFGSQLQQYSRRGEVMKKFLSILALSLIIAIAPAHVYANEAGAEVPDVEEDPMQRIRCRNQRVTGSNARRIRVCMTMAEWSVLPNARC